MSDKHPVRNDKSPIGNDRNPAAYFGKQLRKARLARGWSLDDLGRRSGVHPAHLSRVETGHRAPTEKVALACDNAFGDGRNDFWELYQEVSTWAPPGFRDWSEHEEKTETLRDWSPSVITGLLQTERYARSILETSPGATEEITATRLKSRMERQRRLFTRDVRAWFIVDDPSLRRLATSPEVMAEQMDRLLEVASLPNVTLQVLPCVVHPAGASGFVITDSAAYVEHVTGGFVYTEPQAVTRLDILFDTLRAESYRVSESLAIIREMRETWERGASPLTQTPTAGTA